MPPTSAAGCSSARSSWWPRGHRRGEGECPSRTETWRPGRAWPHATRGRLTSARSSRPRRDCATGWRTAGSSRALPRRQAPSWAAWPRTAGASGASPTSSRRSRRRRRLPRRPGRTAWWSASAACTACTSTRRRSRPPPAVAPAPRLPARTPAAATSRWSWSTP